jgi:hypothetical protein
VVIKKSSVEKSLSSSGVPSEQLVEGWALQRHYEFRCGVLTSGQRREHGSRKISTVKSVARKRLVKTVIDCSHESVCVSDL